MIKAYSISVQQKKRKGKDTLKFLTSAISLRDTRSVNMLNIQNSECFLKLKHIKTVYLSIITAQVKLRSFGHSARGFGQQNITILVFPDRPRFALLVFYKSNIILIQYNGKYRYNIVIVCHSINLNINYKGPITKTCHQNVSVYCAITAVKLVRRRMLI